MDEFEITNRDEIRSFLDEFFESFFEEQLDEEYFDQESDRLDAAQDARRFMGLVDDYEAGEISWEELISEENLPRDMLSYDDTFTDYYNAIMSSFEAEEIISALETNPERLNDPVFDRLSFPQTEQIITDSAFSFAGTTPTTPITTVGNRVVIRGGAGVTIDIKQVIDASGQVFGEGGILEAVVPYIPGISLPSWMPTAGVIFLPSVGKAIENISNIIAETDISGAIEEGNIGEILNDIGTIIVGAGGELVSEVEGQINKVLGQIQGAVADPTQAGTIIGGVLAGSFPSGIPDWLGGILAENIGGAVYGAVRNVLVDSGTATEEQLPLTQVETEQDPTLMFTNRGNNVFVSKEGDEFFVLNESEDVNFELNGQYTREQLENTGLEIVDSGRYQELLNNLSFHALEEDIYQYTMADLVARYEEEGGVLPGDWKLMDEESQYSFFLDDYFDVPVRIEDPDRGEGPADEEPPVEPEPEPEPPTDEPEPAPEMDTSVIEGLFADFLEQIDTEFTGQQEQINTIINNFVQTLPDFDAMPTMEDIAEYFEVNGVTLSQQNFDRIREELANAGYLTQEQLTEALAGVATPEQVQQAIEGAGFATPEQVIQALAEAGYATPDDITAALNNSGFVTEDRMLQALAEAGYATPEQVEQIVNNAVSNIVIPEGATTEEVRQLIQEAINGIPAGISLDDVSGVVNEAIANIDFPEGLSDSDVRNIVGSFGFTTSDEVRSIINEAIAGIVIPEGATTEEVRQLIQEAIEGIPPGISLDEVGGLINEAIENIDFPPGLSGDDVRGIVDSFGFATSADVQAGFDNLNDKIDNVLNGVATQFTEQEAEFAADLLGLETSVFQQLAATEGALRDELLGLGEDLDSIRADFSGRFDEFADTFAAFQTDVGEQFADLNDRFDDAINGIATQFSDQEAEFLASITGLEASLIQSLAAVEGGLSTELEMLDQDLVSLREDVAGRFDEFQDFTSQQFELAADERRDLQQAIIAANGDITQLSLDMQEQFANFGGTITDLFAGVGIDIAALQAGQITQEEALNQLRISLSEQLTTASEERQELQQAIISVGGDVTQLSDDMMLRFQQQDQTIEELFAGTNVNIEALRQGQITQQEAFDAYQQYTTEQFGQAQQDRLALAQEIISVGGQVENLSAESQQRFNELNLSLSDLQEEFNVNLLGLQQGQISQAEAFGQFRDSVTTRLTLGEEEREEILTRQADFERVYGEQQEELQQQIMGGNILTALAAGGMFGGAPSAPAPAPFKGFKKELTYSPLQVPELAIKTPALDYNEESQKLLRRIRPSGMLTDTGRVA